MFKKKMSFWNIFSTPQKDATTATSELHRELKELFPEEEEENLIKSACLAGLMARVAWCDLDIAEKEVGYIEKTLAKWTNFPPKDLRAIATVALSHIQELAGLENYKYTEPLATSLSLAQRFDLLKGLFALAASDGEVANKEAEEIRLIAKGLKLEREHFISARATVLEYLASLKGDYGTTT